MKYKKPALKSITAFTSVKYEDKTKFIEWFARKGELVVCICLSQR